MTVGDDECMDEDDVRKNNRRQRAVVLLRSRDHHSLHSFIHSTLPHGSSFSSDHQQEVSLPHHRTPCFYLSMYQSVSFVILGPLLLLVLHTKNNEKNKHSHLL